MTALSVSIVIASWNTRQLLLECVECAEHAARESRELAGEVQIIVVDNGSSDGSAQACRERFPALEIIALPENVGFARGINAGLARASGEIVLLLNTDVQLTAAALDVSVSVFRGHPRAGIVGVQLVHADGRLQNSVHAFPSLATEMLPLFALELLWPSRYPSKRRSPGGDPGGAGRPVEVEAVHGAALWVRREVLEAVGPLPEEYFFFLEETAWCWRVREAGWSVLHIPEVRLVHAAGSSSKQPHPGPTAIEYHRSLYRFLRDHRGPGVARLACLVRGLRALVSVVTHGVAAPFSARLRRRWHGRWAVLLWHLRGLPDGEGLASLGASSAAPPS